MNKYLIFCFAFLILAVDENAADVFKTPMIFRGRVDNNSFFGSRFKVEMVDNVFIFSDKNIDDKFTFQRNEMVMADAAISSGGSAVAALFATEDPKISKYLLSVSNPQKILGELEYSIYRLSSKYGWIVEIGSVSDSGEFLLLKCATLLPAVDGVRNVNHYWVIFNFKNGNLIEVDAKDAFAKWGSYAEK